MTITYRSDLDRPLTSEELDGNFHDSDDRLTAIEDNPPTPIEITNIYAEGSQCHVVLANATEFVFTLPQANFRPSIVGTLDAPTDGVYSVTNADSNRYWRYEGGGDVTIELPATALTDMEVTFRQLGDGVLIFSGATDVTINGMEGFLNLTASPGSTVTAKFAATGEWDLIGRIAEDVTA
ncbi:MAG: hypothetical protein EOS27_27095 [Mesorhizobium sp.]|nr:MAG: hypothetical protein EOS27_27095 [Mesorhizobium sp.]